MLTRRTFIQSAGTLAAGAAFGGAVFRGIKKHGPVELRAYFFSEKPTIIKADLFSDEAKNVFGIRVFVDKKEDKIARLRLSDVREAVAVRDRYHRCVVEESDLDLNMYSNGVDFMFVEAKSSGSPMWLKLADVERVL